LKLKIVIFLLFLSTLVAIPRTWGGDAVAFDYSTGLGGLYFSGTPDDGADYREADDARAPALESARKQGAKEPIIIHQSDRTGHFCVAIGFDAQNRFVAYVGEGDTAENAKADAYRGLKAYGVTSKSETIYEYFSFGSRVTPPKLGK
jgi:hypothetical protein